MGVSMRRSGVPQSPDEAKKLSSGFWKRESRLDTNEIIWRCDLHALNEAVRDILMDQRESMMFSQDPHRYLDTRFGSDTARVYFSKHNDKTGRYLNVRANPYLGDNMAYWNTGTATNTTTTTTSGTSTDFYMYDSIRWARDEMEKRILRETAIPKDILKDAPAPKLKKKAVKTLPFKVDYTGDLMKTLQAEFDHWAGDAMRTLQPAGR